MFQSTAEDTEGNTGVDAPDGLVATEEPGVDSFFVRLVLESLRLTMFSLLLLSNQWAKVKNVDPSKSEKINAWSKRSFEQSCSNCLFYAAEVKHRLNKIGGFNMNLILLQRPRLHVIQ